MFAVANLPMMMMLWKRAVFTDVRVLRSCVVFPTRAHFLAYETASALVEEIEELANETVFTRRALNKRSQSVTGSVLIKDELDGDTVTVATTPSAGPRCVTCTWDGMRADPDACCSGLGHAGFVALDASLHASASVQPTGWHACTALMEILALDVAASLRSFPPSTDISNVPSIVQTAWRVSFCLAACESLDNWPSESASAACIIVDTPKPSFLEQFEAGYAVATAVRYHIIALGCSWSFDCFICGLHAGLGMR